MPMQGYSWYLFKNTAESLNLFSANYCQLRILPLCEKLMHNVEDDLISQ